MIAILLLAALSTAPPEKVALCESCHGPGGNSVIAGTPSIASQPQTFLENQLVFFREGLRNAPVMQGVAAGMKDEEIVALSKHFAAQKAKPTPGTRVDAALATRGRELATGRHCGQCHLPQFEGRNQMPRLAGQREDYLAASMIGYRDDKRTGADTTMSEVLYGVSDADIRALAHYLSQLD